METYIPKELRKKQIIEDPGGETGRELVYAAIAMVCVSAFVIGFMIVL